MLYEFLNVTLRHPSASAPSVCDFDLQVQEGELLVLTGRSGAGKSTLINAMAGFIHPTAGAVLYRGSNLRSMDAYEAARYRNREIGMVHQAYNLLPDLDALTNVMVPLLIRGVDSATARRASIDLLRRLGLEHRALHRPSRMSGGEQQRTAICRALAAQPRVLLADEPTGNLDSASTVAFLDLLKTLHQPDGLTIVLVTHDPVVAAVGTRRVDLSQPPLHRDHAGVA